jgi:hypothetical protein
MRRVTWSWTLLTAILIPLSPVSAQMYKWTDADGKVHYSDQPPPQGAKSQGTIAKPRPAPQAPAQPGETAAAQPAKARTTAEQEMEFRKRRLEKAEAEAKAEQQAKAAEEKKRNCASAQARVTALQTGRVTRTAANGEQVYLEDADIARELVEARKVADSWCKA